MINQGEIDELLVKLRLIELRDKSAKIEILNEITEIKEVGFKLKDKKGYTYYEYKSLPPGIDLEKVERECDNKDLSTLEYLVDYCGIKKAGKFDKADVLINKIGYSVKSHKAAPPAIVNHTPRNGWFRISKKLGLDIGILDSIVEDYWEKRIANIIKEDVYNTDKNSPFSSHKEQLRPYLEYFLFSGSGSQDSEIPAKAMLEFISPIHEDTWSFIDQSSYVDQEWDNMKFSIRSKGMKDKYPDCADSDIIAKWTKFYQGKYKGSLHVRVK